MCGRDPYEIFSFLVFIESMLKTLYLILGRIIYDQQSSETSPLFNVDSTTLFTDENNIL
jgi:hypothetical protein